MAACKKRVLSNSEVKRLLEDSGSELDDVFLENEISSESGSEENVDESAEEISDSSDGDDNTAPQA
jgi:hypothetical protein